MHPDNEDLQAALTYLESAQRGIEYQIEAIRKALGKNHRGSHRVSAEARLRMVAAQKKRWIKWRKKSRS